MGKYRNINGQLYEFRGKCNPKICDAWCCRYVLVKYDPKNSDDDEYFKNHGCEVVKRGKYTYILVPKTCKHLNQKTLKCNSYENRPSACRKYAKRNTDVFSSSKCTYFLKPVIGRRVQIIMKRGDAGS